MLVNELLRTIEDNLFLAEDTVCLDRARLVTEADAKYDGEPMPVKRAMVFRHVLEGMTLDVTSNPVFAGNTSSRPRAWMLRPEFGIYVNEQIRIEHADLVGHLKGKVPEEITQYWESRRFGYGGVGHFSADYGWAVEQGLNEILARIESVRSGADEKQRAFLEGMKIACEAAISWAARYADAAEEAADRAGDPLLAECHRRVAAACRRVPAEPARNFFEGLQAILLAHLGMVLEGQATSMSIGLPDRALARFDDEVRSDPGAATALVRAFLIGVASNAVQGRGTNTQAITVGGADHTGADRCGAVTKVFLDAFDATPVSDPHLFVRWHPAIDDEVMSKAAAMLARGRSMPLLVNDEKVAPAMMEAGVAPEDAWDYCIIGCNELGIPGRACQSANTFGFGHHNDVGVLDRVMRRDQAAVTCTRDLIAGFEKETERTAEEGLAKRLEQVTRLADGAPFPFCSALCHGSVEKGNDLLRAMPYSDIYGFYVLGTSNAVNALAAVDAEVFGGKGRPLAEYIAGVDEGDPALLERIAAAPKWGNDDEEADRWAVVLNEARDRALRRVSDRHQLPPFAVCHVVRSLHHFYGKPLGATPDGRGAGEPLGDSIGAVHGTARNGPTATLNSVLKLDALKWFSGIYNLNITLAAGQAAPEVIRSLMEAFFTDGGQEIQINVLDAEKLRDAKEHPERYRDLVVRIAGLNARFVELSDLEQDELIRRAEAL
jgi:formate C-acetyltransferase